MKTIVYKKLFNKYRIAEIRESDSADLTLRFEEPIEAKLFIGEGVFSVYCGIAKIPKSHLHDGEISPKLYTGTGKEDIEGFISVCGEVAEISCDSEFKKSVGEAVVSILHRLDLQDKAILQIKDRLDQKLKF